MRTRSLAAGAAVALALALLTTLPASAAYQDPLIEFPNGTSVFYSPFSGPATVTFTFDADTNDATFELRLRRVGGPAIRTREVFIDPDTMESPHAVSFSWPAISVGSAKTYQVAVYRGGNLQGSPESFQVLPPLVSITGATPNPFLPWVDDDIKDETRISYTLEAPSDPTIVRIFGANSHGKCCGPLVFEQDDGSQPAGVHQYEWNGRTQELGGSLLPKGDYFVKIRAEDASHLVGVSKPFKVAIARTYRAVKTKTKPARDYHHRSASTPIVIGGGCYVMEWAGDLRILCQGGRVSVYWRWGLDPSRRIERASFVVDTQSGNCPKSIRRSGHTKHESSFTVNEDLAGASGDCRIVTAKITFSYLQAS
jgi:FlgD Ig-like domain